MLCLLSKTPVVGPKRERNDRQDEIFRAGLLAKTTEWLLVKTGCPTLIKEAA